MNRTKIDIKIQKAHSTLLLFGIFSMVMLFAGLTSAYIVHKNSLTQYNLGLCSFTDSTSTLKMYSSFEDEPVVSGYFVYQAEHASSESLLLGVVNTVDSKISVSNNSDMKVYDSPMLEHIITLKQVKSSVSSFDDQFCVATKWDYIDLPYMFYISTLVIFLSSLFGWLAIRFCKQNNFRLVRLFLLITLCFGLLFFVFQFLGWNHLVKNFRYIGGDNNVASSYLYILTGSHLVHLIGGIITLIVIYFKSLFNKYNIDNFHGIKLGIRFWHFLGLLWLYLFLFLLIIN